MLTSQPLGITAPLRTRAFRPNDSVLHWRERCAWTPDRPVQCNVLAQRAAAQGRRGVQPKRLLQNHAVVDELAQVVKRGHPAQASPTCAIDR